MSRKHDDYMDELVNLIRGRYLIILTNVNYQNSPSIIGEIDVLAIRHNRFDIYEVKATNNPKNMKTAVDQVKKARDYLGQQGKEFLYTPKAGIESIEKIIKRLEQRKQRKQRNNH